MAKLIYSMITSLDGYVADEHGDFDWAVPDEEVHRFVNDLQRPIGTYLLGRRMYEVMLYWEDATAFAGEPGLRAGLRDRLAGGGQDRVLADARASDEREDADRAGVRSRGRASTQGPAERDMAVAGPELAAQAMRAGLVDELQLVVAPVVIGGGKQALPDGLRLDLELLDQRRFAGGMTYLRYGITGALRGGGRGD